MKELGDRDLAWIIDRQRRLFIRDVALYGAGLQLAAWGVFNLIDSALCAWLVLALIVAGMSITLFAALQMRRDGIAAAKAEQTHRNSLAGS